MLRPVKTLSRVVVPSVRGSVRCLGTLYENQGSLPTMPVIDMPEALHKFRRSLLGLRATNPTMPETEAAAIESDEDVARMIDDMLKDGSTSWTAMDALRERAAATPNWLEQWWDTSYVADRTPVQYANYALEVNGTGSDTQALTAAKLVHSAMQLYHNFLDESAPAMADRAGPLDMSQCARMMGHARIPAQGVDDLVVYGPEPEGLTVPHFHTTFTGDLPSHVALLHKGSIWKLDVLGENRAPISVSNLEKAITDIMNTDAGVSGMPIAAYTGDERDSWAANRARLLRDPANARALADVDSAIIVVCLDDTQPSAKDTMHQLLFGAKSNPRWFDKHEIVVLPSGRAGVNMEHAPGDGTTALLLTEHLFNNYANPETGNVDAVTSAASTRLEFVDNEPASITTAGSDTTVIPFDAEFGASVMKSLGTAPDAFVQVAMQVATYNILGKCLPSYESVAIRGFLHGRTETGRGSSLEATAAAEAIAAGDRSAETAHLVRSAAMAHANYCKMAKDANGCDRLMYGLVKMHQELGLELPELLRSAAYSYSSTWYLSTSNCGAPSIARFAFAPVAPNGVGMGYAITSDAVNMSVSHQPNPLSDDLAYLYADALGVAMAEMRGICEEHPLEK